MNTQVQTQALTNKHKWRHAWTSRDRQGWAWTSGTSGESKNKWGHVGTSNNEWEWVLTSTNICKVRHGYRKTHSDWVTGIMGTGMVLGFDTPQHTVYPYHGITGISRVYYSKVDLIFTFFPPSFLVFFFQQLQFVTLWHSQIWPCQSHVHSHLLAFIIAHPCRVSHIYTTN